MPRTILGIGDFSMARDGAIVTHALGSCVAVVIHAPQLPAGAMAHCALPGPGDASSESRPGYFVSTAVPRLVEGLHALGADLRLATITVLGGASVVSNLDTFNIGPRNVLAVRKALWRYGLQPTAEDVGGELSRTVELDIPSGRVVVSNPTTGRWLVCSIDRRSEA